LIRGLVVGDNRAVFKFITASIPERLMSGAMWTSSANGILNLCIMSYLSSQAVLPDHSPAQRAEWSATSFVGLVEGDDGICLDYGISNAQIKALALDLDFQPHDHYSQANFCGITCPRIGDGCIITDPLAVLRKFFVIPPQYMHSRPSVKAALIRAKSLSYITLYKDCPIVGPLAHRCLFLTRGIDARPYRREQALYFDPDPASNHVDGMFKAPKISASSRDLMAEKFGISIERQLAIEMQIAASGPCFVVSLLDLLDPVMVWFAHSHLTCDPNHPGSSIPDPPLNVLKAFHTDPLPKKGQFISSFTPG
jgi:hypothetical protein